MEVNNLGGMALSPLVVYFSTAEIITTIIVFLTASTKESFEKTVRKPFPRLRIFQLALTGLLIALNVSHVGLLSYPNAFYSSKADSTVTCALFILLTWVILLLPLIDRKGDAAYPHYLSWACLLVFEIINTFLVLFAPIRGSSVQFWIDFGVIVSKLVVLLVLLVGSALTKLTFKRKEHATEEETQPLLDGESSDSQDTEANAGTGGNGNTNTEDTETSGDDDDDDNDAEMKADLEELKKRSWSEYLGSFKIFLPHLRPRSKAQFFSLAVMLACTGIGRVLNVFIPLSLGWVVNGLQGASELPWSSLGLYLVLYFINSSAGVSVIQNLASVRLSMSMRMSMDIFVYNHIMNLDAKFHDSKKTATLGRITDRGDTVIDLFQEFFFELMPTVADLFISLAVLQWLFGAYVSFIVAMTGILFGWSNTHLIKNRTSLRRKYVDAWCAMYEHAFETQYNWATVSHFGRIAHEQENYRTKNSKKVTEELALTTYTSITRTTRQLIVTIGFICASLFAANQIVKGHRKVGDFVMLVTYWSSVMSPVRSIISTITTVSERLVDAEKLLLVLEKRPDVFDHDDAPDFDFKGGDVEFQDVTFSYDGKRTVSEGISFRADAGQTIALVGETGGGKSTLLKLLFRFYDPKAGRVLVDGQDISKVKMESFRKLVGIVPQDPALFNRTVFDNVKYPNENATEEQVIEACKGACLHDKIMTFAKQYKEKVGERGTKMSGGECQRLAIARAILKKPKMLLLDEATSSVDSVTENKIQSCLKELCKGRTTFVIAHRLSTILHADQIMVIKGGKLMEMGSHRNLIRRKGAYRELWDAQLNMELQNPGDMSEQSGEVDEEGSKTSKDKKSANMFYNDMGEEEISEELLQKLWQDMEETETATTGHESETDLKKAKAEFASEDVTEVGSTIGSDSESSTKKKQK